MTRIAMTGLIAAAASASAWAHVGVHADGGFSTGFAHPFFGLDHLLAMVAVGIWAVQIGGRSLWALPSAFVIFMAIGAALGAAGMLLPQVEGMIAVSVLALGCVVGLSARLAWYWAIPLVAVFAVFHGHAHGTEMPDFSSPWTYFAGFALASALLHAVGVASASALKKHPGIVQAGGAAIGLIGGWLVFSL